jgi:biotin carboxyl carrier protein
MKLMVTIDGAEQQIEILAPAPAYRFRINDERERTANVESPEPGIYSVLMDGRSYEARVERTPAGLAVHIEGHRFEVEVRDPRRWSRRNHTAGAGGIENISAPMPGKVVRVLVAAGESVEVGQGLVVVEAMKMQNEMKASRAGKVLAVAVGEGATIAAGEVLVTIG